MRYHCRLYVTYSFSQSVYFPQFLLPISRPISLDERTKSQDFVVNHCSSTATYSQPQQYYLGMHTCKMQEPIPSEILPHDGSRRFKSCSNVNQTRWEPILLIVLPVLPDGDQKISQQRERYSITVYLLCLDFMYLHLKWSYYALVLYPIADNVFSKPPIIALHSSSVAGDTKP